MLRLTYSAEAFPLSLRSPFGFSFPAALPPPAARCMKRNEAYSLFFNGLLH